LKTQGFDPLRRSPEGVAKMTSRSLENSVVASQASGMVSIQAHCSVTEATALMKHYGESNGLTLHQVASSVVGGSLRFSPESLPPT
jgi:hypothetical protein